MTTTTAAIEAAILRAGIEQLRFQAQRFPLMFALGRDHETAGLWGEFMSITIGRGLRGRTVPISALASELIPAAPDVANGIAIQGDGSADRRV